jgi:hypothetical protein
VNAFKKSSSKNNRIMLSAASDMRASLDVKELGPIGPSQIAEARSRAVMTTYLYKDHSAF